MDPKYKIEDTSEIISPGLVIFRELMEDNLDQMIAIAGRTDRLRPHCKTHKIRQVTEIELAKGITKHKAATFAEAEMLATAGVKDVFLAYNLVGPNIQRAVRFREAYPDVAFCCTVDHPTALEQLGRAMESSGQSIGVLLDINTGLQRTGVDPSREAAELYRRIADTAGVEPAGLHVYDGQNHQQSLNERSAAVHAAWSRVIEFRDQLTAAGLVVPKIVAGGTGTFPIYAAIDEPTLELSPGTTVFHDIGYSETFPDMKFHWAAMLLTRVISRPADDRVTFDAGTKGCASDPPMGRRLFFPDLPDAEQLLQNEEHLVLRTSNAGDFQPGDEQLAVPRHICPTTALHKQVYVVAGGKVVDRWDVIARDRWLNI